MAKECSLCGRRFKFAEVTYPVQGSDEEYCRSHLDVWNKINDMVHENPDVDQWDAVLAAREILDNRCSSFDSTVILITENVRKGLTEEDKEEYRKRKRYLEDEKRLSEAHKTVLLTTGSSFEGYNVIRYIDVVCEEVFYKNSISTSMSLAADCKDSIAWRGVPLQNHSDNIISDAKEYAFARFRRSAAYAGANAVLGVNVGFDFDGNIVRVSVSGTAVEITKE